MFSIMNSRLKKKPTLLTKKSQNKTTETVDLTKTREQLIEDLLLQKEVNNKYFTKDSTNQDGIVLKSRNSNLPVKEAKPDINSDSEDDLDEDEWDEVKINDQTSTALSKETIEIKLESDKKNKNKCFDFGAYMIRTYKNLQKKLTIEMHKSHLICWLYHGFYMNKLTTNKLISAIALSLCDQYLLQFRNESMGKELFNSLLTYLHEKIIANENFDDRALKKSSIVLALQNMKYNNKLEFILVILTFLRCLNIRSRLCISFDVVPLKEEVKKGNQINDEEDFSSDEVNVVKSSSVEDNDKKVSRKRKSVDDECNEFKEETKKLKINSKNKSVTSKLIDKRDCLDRKCKSVSQHHEDEKIIEEEISGYLEEDDIEFKVKEKREKNSKKVVIKKEEANILKLKTNKTKILKNNKVLSDDESLIDINIEKSSHYDYSNYWIEVYLDKEERWISVDPIKIKLDFDTYFEKRLNKRLLYVCSFDNENKVKDVTKRYAADWNTYTRKLRIEHFDTTFWWEKVLVRYKPVDYQMSINEDKLINGKTK